jgi:hypothetical protein
MQLCHELCSVGEGGDKMGGKGFSHGNNSGRGAKGSILRAYALNLCDCWFIWVYLLKFAQIEAAGYSLSPYHQRRLFDVSTLK